MDRKTRTGSFMKSLWRQETKCIKNSKQVSEEEAQKVHWDVIVVGAGMGGLLIAYYLKEQGKKVLVLEAKEIASGQTERTTAKITSQHGLKYSSLIKSVGAQKAKLYAQANEAAIREYDKLVKKKKIDCQFERIPSYLYTKQDVALLHEEAAAAAFLGIDAFFTKETELPFEVEGAVCFRDQAQFAPLEFIRYISAELNILEHTQVLKIRGHKVITKDSVFLADKIVVATHYPMVNVPGFYFIRQHRKSVRKRFFTLGNFRHATSRYRFLRFNGKRYVTVFERRSYRRFRLYCRSIQRPQIVTRKQPSTINRSSFTSGPQRLWRKSKRRYDGYRRPPIPRSGVTKSSNLQTQKKDMPLCSKHRGISYQVGKKMKYL